MAFRRLSSSTTGAGAGGVVGGGAGGGVAGATGAGGGATGLGFPPQAAKANVVRRATTKTDCFIPTPLLSRRAAAPPLAGEARAGGRTRPSPEGGRALGLLRFLLGRLVPQGLLEVLDALAQATSELGNPAGPEDQHHDDENEEHLGKTEVEHDIPSRETGRPTPGATPGPRVPSRTRA